MDNNRDTIFMIDPHDRCDWLSITLFSLFKKLDHQQGEKS